jgi:hypothetical protein
VLGALMGAALAVAGGYVVYLKMGGVGYHSVPSAPASRSGPSRPGSSTYMTTASPTTAANPVN